MSTLLDLSFDLLNLVFSHLHKNDLCSLKRTNSEFHNLTINCCDCRSTRLNKLNIYSACNNGYLDVIIWLHNNNKNEGCVYLAMDYAAENRYLDIVK